MRVQAISLLAVALLLPMTSHADPEHKGEDKHAEPAQPGSSARPAAAASAQGASSHDDADDEDGDKDKDQGPPPSITRTSAQTEFRDRWLTKERQTVKEQYGRRGQDRREARLAVGQHWRWVMRLIRIRELAEDAKDTATVKQVDELLAKVDGKLTARMDKARTKDGSPAMAASAGTKPEEVRNALAKPKTPESKSAAHGGAK